MKFKLLITSSNYSDGSIEREILNPLDAEVIVANSPTEEDVIMNGKGVNGILVGYTPIGIKAMQSLPDLKIIVRTGIGVENLDLKIAQEKGIRICNVPDYCLNEVADHAMALLLCLERKIVNQSNSILVNGKWGTVKEIAPVYGLGGRTLGLVGFGGIGKNVARRAQSFGLKVIAYDPYAKTDSARELGVELVTFEKLISESDYLSLHAPLTESTRHIINRDALSKVRASTYLINTSRGGLVDTDALVEALQEYRLAGAALDVVEDDLTGALKFVGLKNVIITPHTGYYSLASSRKMKVKSAEEIARFIKGEKLRNQLV